MKTPGGSVLHGLPVWLYCVPPILLILAPVFDWPDGYYQILRLLTFGISGIISFFEYRLNRKNLAVVAGLVAVLFNPFLQVSLDSEIWTVIDFGVASLWVAYLWKSGMKVTILGAIFTIPILIVVAGPISQELEEHGRQVRVDWEYDLSEVEAGYAKLVSIENIIAQKVKSDVSDKIWRISGLVKNNSDEKLSRVLLSIYPARVTLEDLPKFIRVDPSAETQPDADELAITNALDPGASVQCKKDIYAPGTLQIALKVKAALPGESISKERMRNMLKKVRNNNQPTKAILCDLNNDLGGVPVSPEEKMC